MTNVNIVRPAMYNGEKFKDYGVDRNSGNIYSFKTRVPKKLAWAHRNRKNLKISYPCINLIDENIFPNHCNNQLTTNVHIIVQETLNLCPIPIGVTEKEWRTTANSVKNACRGLWVVNHKDHNKLNFHPSNLEWVFGPKENAQKAKEHYSK